MDASHRALQEGMRVIKEQPCQKSREWIGPEQTSRPGEDIVHQLGVHLEKERFEEASVDAVYALVANANEQVFHALFIHLFERPEHY